MDELSVQIKELQSSLQAFVKKYSTLQKENEHLKNVNAGLKKNLLEKEDTMQFAQQKIDAKAMASVYDEDEKKLLQQRIDLYLRDIDKCLSLLNA